MVEAASFSVSGFHGFLILLAVIVFFVAALAAYFAPAHRLVHILIAAGLCIFGLSFLVSG
jgi:hypothetical protein